MNNILGASAWTLKEDALQQYGYDDVDKVCVIYIHVHSYDARMRVCVCMCVSACVYASIRVCLPAERGAEAAAASRAQFFSIFLGICAPSAPSDNRQGLSTLCLFFSFLLHFLPRFEWSSRSA